MLVALNRARHIFRGDLDYSRKVTKGKLTFNKTKVKRPPSDFSQESQKYLLPNTDNNQFTIRHWKPLSVTEDTKYSVKRGKYFSYYRRERNLLNTILNSYSDMSRRKNYRTYRYLYYFVLPRLSTYMWFPPDREKIITLEDTLYTWLVSYHFQRNRRVNPTKIDLSDYQNPLHYRVQQKL